MPKEENDDFKHRWTKSPLCPYCGNDDWKDDYYEPNEPIMGFCDEHLPRHAVYGHSDGTVCACPDKEITKKKKAEIAEEWEKKKMLELREILENLHINILTDGVLIFRFARQLLQSAREDERKKILKEAEEAIDKLWKQAYKIDGAEVYLVDIDDVKGALFGTMPDKLR